MEKENKHYGTIDGLRTIAAFGIVIMHIRANTNYIISGYLYNKVIPSFTNFVFLFMVISAFGMYSGYYEKFLNNKIVLSDFYKKRFKKVLPFFSILVILDVLLFPSVESFYEGFCDLTLMFGFLPKFLSVIGVGWFLGLIFIFYISFPFFVFLLETKKRAWIVFALSLIYNYISYNFFDLGRNNILYSACFFIAGGLIYLYRQKRLNYNKNLIFFITVIIIIAYYVFDENVYICLSIACMLLICAILKQGGILENKITKFFSSISLEIYLSHMLIFRVIEKLKLNIILGNGWVQFLLTLTMVICGTTIFSYIVKRIIDYMFKTLEKLKI
ncbi:acyltransferase family protein [Fusobacterium sp.]|uniref:acyltransferase family protein n=1 Tax=Fusobacterium sp. TaxID=68766 RepID=UPI002E779E9B|nr:acyltransferase [Fusobacterium sp.]MEE1475932.1 acyltransferase [Fusobacterium sp.]